MEVKGWADYLCGLVALPHTTRIHIMSNYNFMWCTLKLNSPGPAKDHRDIVEFIYLLIDLFTIFDTAEVETPVFLAISAMGIPYSEKSLIAIQNRTLQIG